MRQHYGNSQKEGAYPKRPPEKTPLVPRGYLGGSYFREGKYGCKVVLKEGLVTTIADEIAQAIRRSRPQMTVHQLRRFFGYARGIERRLEMGTDFDCLRSEIERLVTYVVDARGKAKVPVEFETFIRENAAVAVKDRDSFEKGFMAHFEAVVAYFAYWFGRTKVA